ncbi:hypothetical protein NZA98_39650, partial [Escherichia coli]|nr:hypothetical protein [Escherichia coli]
CRDGIIGPDKLIDIPGHDRLEIVNHGKHAFNCLLDVVCSALVKWHRSDPIDIHSGAFEINACLFKQPERDGVAWGSGIRCLWICHCGKSRIAGRPKLDQPLGYVRCQRIGAPHDRVRRAAFRRQAIGGVQTQTKALNPIEVKS